MSDDLGVEVIELAKTRTRPSADLPNLASVPQCRSGAVVEIVPSWPLTGRGGCRLGEGGWFSCISRSTPVAVQPPARGHSSRAQTLRWPSPWNGEACAKSAWMALSKRSSATGGAGGCAGWCLATR